MVRQPWLRQGNTDFIFGSEERFVIFVNCKNMFLLEKIQGIKTCEMQVIHI